MSINRKPRKTERPLCAQLHEDDGIDPKEYFRASPHRRDDRKTRQLCKQVYRTLSCLLAGQFGDPVLQDLSVQAVEPAPDASRLLVTVRLTTLRGQVSPEHVLASLARVRGALRCEVAASVRRRKAPELVYRLAGPVEMTP
ncbi:MAG TPA: ribosome-binding factor A [Phycisphaerae bacterium]|jgi:ribosome-binding factor A|nr:ribosome-binding factor A [Phycisphaerae bacterium]HOJ54174.1 ribosome-binding factor A [Phycisphaerae bacterium]HOL26635.1 ribosome-binding factor A [Phycisphaerae bacterium]HPP20369.1 ribosome-binding factor A [Phycisphaerae bacterium]HPU32770.1 ribosome-binding factor A [Phycisphaerae bacterium]